MGNLSVGFLRKKALESKYLLLNSVYGYSIAINSKSILIGENKKKDENLESEFNSFKEIEFNEYISRKIPFIKK